MFDFMALKSSNAVSLTTETYSNILIDIPLMTLLFNKLFSTGCYKDYRACLNIEKSMYCNNNANLISFPTVKQPKPPTSQVVVEMHKL